MSKRVFWIVLDSVGCGGAPDAADFGDAGSVEGAHADGGDTVGDIKTGQGGVEQEAFAQSGHLFAV